MAVEWQTIPIREVYAGMYDGPHATPKPSESGPIFLGIKNVGETGQLDLSSIRHISEEEYPRWIKRVEPRHGDIVFSYEATLNRYAMIPKGFRGCLGRRMALIRPDKSKTCGRFLYYYLFGQKWRNVIAQNTLIGSTVDRIPIAKFPDFPITIPPLPTQRKIASILSAYDDLIENNLRRIKILEEMAQALYREWFVKFRFPGHEKVQMVDSPLGKIPEGWEVMKLGERVELAYGRGLRKAERKPGDIPVFGSSGIVGYHNQSIADGPGIVVGRKGNVGTVFWSDTAFYPIDTVFYVKTDLPVHYVFYNLQHQNFINNDAAVPGLNRNQAHSLPFIVPAKRLIDHFSESADLAFQQTSNLKSRVENLRQTRDLLLPKLISGELDVSHLDISIPEEAA